MDEIAQELGFESAQEMHHLISRADISTPGKLVAFENWKASDGTKAGMMALLKAIAINDVSKCCECGGTARYICHDKAYCGKCRCEGRGTPPNDAPDGVSGVAGAGL